MTTTRSRVAVRGVLLVGGAVAMACTGGGGGTDGSSASAIAVGNAAVPAPMHRAGFSAYLAEPPAQAPLLSREVVSADRRARARVASVDEQRQVPTFMWAPRVPAPRGAAPMATPVAARYHMRQFAGAYRLDAAALDHVELSKVHDTGRGAVVVHFGQRVAGLEVYGQEAKVVMTRDQSLVAIAGTLHSSVARDEAAVRDGFALSAADAVGRALGDLYDLDVRTALVASGADQAGYEHLALDADFQVGGHAYRFVTPARVRRVAYPLPDRLVSAYLLEVDAAPRGTGSADMYRYVVAAGDGRVLERHDLTAYDSYDYRVFADPDLRPMDGPVADHATPHPTGNDDGFVPDFAAPRLVTVDGLNVHGDPWLPPDASETRGNNVDAYADHEDPSGFGTGDSRGATTAPNVFDHIFDPGLGPFASDTQIQAAVVQLFYVNNWLHDYYYDSGFDEAAGNAQEDNYGRGGAGGDVLLAEAQDTRGRQRNNANMSTPGDGASPRMQMYVFSGGDATSVEITAPPAIAGSYAAVRGSIGASDDVALSGAVALAIDSDGTSTACTPIVNDLTGVMALVDRGDCPFVDKARAVQDAGAVAIIIANNQPGAPISAGGSAGGLTIPVVMISQADGATIRAENDTGISAALSSTAGVLRDGTIDNHISAHEWGHYIHNRLVRVGSTQARGQGEGWGDFFALMLAVRPGDDLGGTYAMGGYATSDAYAGIRRYPYSTDMDKNGLTFRHISAGEPLPGGRPASNNFEVHNAGEVWCAMVFEGFVGLLRESEGESPRYSFEEARRRMADYVVAGMKIAPAAPTFTEQRDAILAAAAAADDGDFAILAAAFARRGAGSGAVSPPRNSRDGTGVVESYELAGALSVGEVAVHEGDDGCDGDGVLDADERGTVTVRVTNTGAAPLENASATVASSAEGVSFPDGATLDLPRLAPFASTDVVIAVALGRAFRGDRLELELTVTDAEAIEPSVVVTTVVAANLDQTPQSTHLETVEGDDAEAVWDIDSVNNAGPWQRRVVASTGNAVWAVDDNDGISDERLVTPALEVSTGADFVVSFEHRYSFEESDGTLWDGGVLELSRDGGDTWSDVSELVDPGYDGALGTSNNDADNPIGLRDGWGGTSAGYDDGMFVAVSLNFGAALAGETVHLRFRLGTDQGAGAPGWEVDNLEFLGIDNTPFTEVGRDAAACTPNEAPVADAGDDANARIGATVALDGTASSDADGDPLTYQWTQVAGPDVTLDDATSPTPSFTAPDVPEPEALIFELVVNDGRADSAADAVIITVSEDGKGSPGDGEGAGCGCHGGGPAPAGGAIALALAFLATVRRRRVS